MQLLLATFQYNARAGNALCRMVPPGRLQSIMALALASAQATGLPTVGVEPPEAPEHRGEEFDLELTKK